MSICVNYSKPSSGELAGEVYGLDVAVNNFLSAWFRHGAQEKFVCLPVDLPSYEHFRELAKAQGVDEGRCIGLDPRTPRHNLENMGLVFRPDPLTNNLIWRREQLRGKGFAACGLVHTMSGERIARAVGELCLAPAGAGDALICPSPAIRDAVQNLWVIYSEYLNEHFGGSYRNPIETPVIPLGTDCEKFARMTTADKRAAQRLALGATADEIVILFVGRLSFATKAHPLALWMAAERAAKLTRKKLRLVMYGYFKPKDMEQHFRTLAADIAKTVRIDFVQNEDPRFPDGLWAGADLFASLSDNVQESFGLTPVEAMASGLPVVVSDWDGYRGGAREGQDGFLIPTLTPPPEAGLDIATHYYNEQNYGVALVGASQSTAVDIARCTEAIRLLAEDDEKRRVMGASGRARARDVFDWRHIIRAYEELWRELMHKRHATPHVPGVPKGWQAAHPAFPNPWKMFASFPSQHLSAEDRIKVVMSNEQIDALLHHEMNYFVPDLLLPHELLDGIIDIMRHAATVSLGDIVNSFPPEERGRIWRSLGWMLKLGICEVV